MRGPPQLVLPPPPPYPPPDAEPADALGAPAEGAAPEAAHWRPTRTCLLLPCPPASSPPRSLVLGLGLHSPFLPQVCASPVQLLLPNAQCSVSGLPGSAPQGPVGAT